MTTSSYIYPMVQTSTKGLSKEKLDRAAYILRTIAHPTRLSIIELLAHTENLSVKEICETLQCEQSLISHHLINMRLKGLLNADKKGVQVFYSLKERDLIQLLECIEHCNCNM